MFILPIQLGEIKSRKNTQIQNRKNLSFSATSSIPYDSVSFKGKIPVNIFDNYKPVIKKLNGYNLTIHNKAIAEKIKPDYSTENFKELFNFATNNGVYDLNINNKTHFITTSLINPKENPLMSKLVWVTDSCRYFPILKDRYPEAAVPLMENIGKFYKKQERILNKIINNPIEYELNHDWASTAKNGIGHVFNPLNMKSHKWFPHTRLESPGLYLQTMGDLIFDGLQGAPYGYKTAKDISQNSIDAVTNITAYLKNIIYPYAKSTGAWEEKTFTMTPTSDVAIINEGFRKIINLMYSPTDNKEILKVRQRFFNSNNGKVFKDEKGLRDLLTWGEYRIKNDSLQEVPVNNERILDGALSFVAQTEKYSNNTISDVLEIFKRLNQLEKGTKTTPELVRANGTLRYSGDRYLNMTAGHKIDHNKKLPEKTEAQWFMTSDISKSYGTAAKRLLDKIETDKYASKRTLKLLQKALKKETEYINRAYARVTGENSYKANGKPCPPFQIPEAYQAVKTSKGEIIFVPGTHTPLGWAQASLYDASKLMLENLKRAENLTLDKNI